MRPRCVYTLDFAAGTAVLLEGGKHATTFAGLAVTPAASLRAWKRVRSDPHRVLAAWLLARDELLYRGRRD